MFTAVRRLFLLAGVFLAAMALASAQERIVLSADYGAGDRSRVDVTSQVQSMVYNRALNFPVTLDALRVTDPAYGSVKELWIRVREPNGRIDVFRYKDGENVSLRLDPYGLYQNVLAPEWQARFDSYFTRWQEYKRRGDRDEIVSMENRMKDIMGHYGIPGDTPYEYVASPSVAPRPAWSEFRLERASYGAGDRMWDVTGRLQGMIQNNSIQVQVINYNFGGDPAPGARKQLFVIYFHEGRRYERTAYEGEYLRIP